jgi:arylsulfatase A
MVQKPNTVFVLADDMRWGDQGCCNAESAVPTPDIDLLARGNVRYANMHAPSSVWSPSCYGLLTGRCCWRAWLQEGAPHGHRRHLIEPERTTLASLPKAQGYATASCGKWHVGLDKANRKDADERPSGTPLRHEFRFVNDRVDLSQPIANGPNDVGFDYFVVTAACCTGNEPYVYIENDRVTEAPVVDEQDHLFASGYHFHEVDDVSVAQSLPFNLHLALSAPHGPWLPPYRLAGKNNDRTRGDMNVGADESPGKLMHALDDTKLTDTTLALNSSDNGGFGSCKVLQWGKNWIYGHAVCGPFLGIKTDIWEGGSCVPFVVRWPGMLDVNLCRDAGEDSFNQAGCMLRGETSSRDHLITHSYMGVQSVQRGEWEVTEHDGQRKPLDLPGGMADHPRRRTRHCTTWPRTRTSSTTSGIDICRTPRT